MTTNYRVMDEQGGEALVSTDYAECVAFAALDGGRVEQYIEHAADDITEGHWAEVSA